MVRNRREFNSQAIKVLGLLSVPAAFTSAVKFIEDHPIRVEYVLQFPQPLSKKDLERRLDQIWDKDSYMTLRNRFISSGRLIGEKVETHPTYQKNILSFRTQADRLAWEAAQLQPSHEEAARFSLEGFRFSSKVIS